MTASSLKIKTPRNIILWTFIAHYNSIHFAASSSGAHSQLKSSHIQNHINIFWGTTIFLQEMIKWWILEGILLISTWIDKSSTLEWVSFENSTSTCPILGDLGKDFNFQDYNALCNLDGNPPVFWVKSTKEAMAASLMY